MPPPKARPCYVCGRPCLLNSYDLHVAQCRELFEKRESLKPLKERRRLPPDPSTFQTAPMLSSASSSSSVKKLGASMGSMRLDGADSRGAMRAGPMCANDFPEYAELMKCPHCGRNFREESYKKHVRVCQKVFFHKRKQFDSSMARAKGTELLQFRRRGVGGVGGSGALSSTVKSSASKAVSASPANRFGGGAGGGNGGGMRGPAQGKAGLPKWKLDSLAFRQAIREARQVSQAEAQAKRTGVPLHKLLAANPPSKGASATSFDHSFIRCPNCGRSFNEQAADRHIPICKSIINKPSLLKRGSGTPSYSTLNNSSSSVAAPAAPVSGSSSRAPPGYSALKAQSSTPVARRTPPSVTNAPPAAGPRGLTFSNTTSPDNPFFSSRTPTNSNSNSNSNTFSNYPVARRR